MPSTFRTITNTSNCKRKLQNNSAMSSILWFLAILATLAIVVSGAPPANWQEHWFEHNQNVARVFMDNDVAIYYDRDMNQAITWPHRFLGDVWRYAKRAYGNFGPESHMYAIFHARKYSGGHPSYYFSASHDFRNVIDCGTLASNSWESGTGNDLDLPTHEVAHIVESASKGVHNSPAFGIWRDSKWAEIFIYDVYRGIGRQSDATRVYNLFMNARDDFPRANTAWFRDWFYPIYSQHGGSAALNRFLTLLSQNFPRNGQAYARGMNWGEFVHFWSGAAGRNLKSLATTAFGWPSNWENEFNQARRDFPRITYP